MRLPALTDRILVALLHTASIEHARGNTYKLDVLWLILLWPARVKDVNLFFDDRTQPTAVSFLPFTQGANSMAGMGLAMP